MTEIKERIERKKRKVRRDVVSKNLFVLGMLAIPLLHLGFFYFYVNAQSFLISFQVPRYDGSGITDWGFGNYKLFFEACKNIYADSGLGEAVKNTVTWFFVGNGINLPSSLFISYFLFKKIKHNQFFRTVLYLPCVVMQTVLVTLYKYMVGTGGPLFELFDLFQMDYIYIFRTSQYAMKGMIVYCFITGIGGYFMLFGGAMNAIGTDVIEAGQIDGAGPFRELWSIILPGIWPTLSVFLMTNCIGFLGASGPVLLFTKGDYGTNTLSYWIYTLTMNSGGSGADQEYAATIGMVMSIVSLPITLVAYKVLGLDKGIE